jgi:hypothetical protein
VPTQLDRRNVRASARAVLEAHWRSEGFTCPNGTTYPWMWSWDSCFHAVVWAELGRPDRAVAELATVLSGLEPEGWLPHVGYLTGEPVHAAVWGRQALGPGSRWSSIVQPPVHGWAVAELVRRGVELPGDLVERSVAAVRWLLGPRRRSPGGLVEVVHPWETGCDHSPRWDALVAPVPPPASGDPYDEAVWFDRKGELLATVERSPGGAPLHNPAFAVGSVAFTALCWLAADELGGLTGDRGLRSGAEELAGALAQRWDPAAATWVDDGPTAGTSGRIRTAEALLPLLVERRAPVLDAVVAELADDRGIGGRFGVAGVDRREPTFRRGSYWRGPTWPQVDLLLWLGLRRAGRTAAARSLARSTVEGAVTSGWAEYWDPDDATPGGAVPQSWATVAILLLDDVEDGEST